MSIKIMAQCKIFFSTIFFLVFVFQVQAQSFVQVTSDPWYNPETEVGSLRCNENRSTPFPVDWDDDGDLDIVSGSSDGGLSVCYFENMGNSITFNEYRLTASENSRSSPYVMDWDGDGDQDIFLGAGNKVFYYENTGDGFLDGGDEFETEATFLSLTNAEAKPAIIDWDADGDLDFVVGEDDDTLEYFENAGDNVTFDHTVDWLGIDGGSNTDPAFGDVNDDGYEDLVLGSQSEFIDYYQNNGVGDFEDPISHYQNIETGGSTQCSSPRFVDWDHDGHLDFIMGNSGGYIALYLNDWDEDGYVGSDDCNNEDATINIAATEVCDGIDNNCNGGPDENGTADGTAYYLDSDEDEFGDENTEVIACAQPVGYVTDNTDCNDNDATASAITTWYYDADADGFGAESTSTTNCGDLTNFVANSTDCNDSDAELTTECPSTSDNDDATDDGTTTSSSGCSLQVTTQNHSQIILEISLSILALLSLLRSQKLTTQSQAPNP